MRTTVPHNPEQVAIVQYLADADVLEPHNVDDVVKLFLRYNAVFAYFAPLERLFSVAMHVVPCSPSLPPLFRLSSHPFTSSLPILPFP